MIFDCDNCFVIQFEQVFSLFLQDVVRYSMLNSSFPGSSYFFVDQETGVISTRKALTDAPLNLYTVSCLFFKT